MEIKEASWTLKTFVALGELTFGGLVAFASDWQMDFWGMPEWIYQLILGLCLVMSGISLSNTAEDKPSLFPAIIYNIVAIVIVFVGVVVFLNFGRYNEILSLAGLWPLYFLGGLYFLSGLLNVVHYLTVYERPRFQPSRQPARTDNMRPTGDRPGQPSR